MTNKTMKILFVSSGNLHANNACTTRIFDQLYSSVDTKQHSIFFLGFVSAKVFLTKKKNIKQRQAEILQHGIQKAFFVPLSFITQPTIIGDTARMLAGLLITLVARFFAVDLVHSSPDEAGLLLCRAKTMGLRRPIITDLHGAGPEEYRDANVDSTLITGMHRFVKETEKDIVHWADTVMLVSQAMVEHLRFKYAPFPKRTLVIPCAVVTRNNHLERNVREHMRRQLKLHNRFVVLYCGSLAVAYQKAEDVISFFVAIKQSVPHSILFLLTPDGDKGAELCKQAGISKQDYLIKFAPHEDVGRYMQVGDIGLLPRANKILNQVSSPTKFGEYLAAGMPVVLSPYINDAAKIVPKYNIGFVNDNWTSVSSDMRHFFMNVRDQRDIWFRRCRQFILDSYNWNLMAAKMIAEWQIMARR